VTKRDEKKKTIEESHSFLKKNKRRAVRLARALTNNPLQPWSKRVRGPDAQACSFHRAMTAAGWLADDDD
jgi:hypothetical protein